ncbi:phosphatidate cytidylyltransferase [Neorhodopirellula pilleata]|uniref:Phosphatidate cytidylyltransferase n=1 Tax=Neorhodopirellula pilleata TaxID=2714738 RepID=A0A5C6APN5_9BACT|nr:phosphatidate cytidylyltransferase [Neorhodopirellula pilleata]TWU01955.1 Phosphatidate cytidylyltransferase [Neorhodopirellula pilleata]
MLADRLRSSFALILGTAAFLYLDARYHTEGAGGLFLIPLLLFFVFGTASDLTGLVTQAGFPVHRMVTVGGAILVALSPSIVMIWNASSWVMPQSVSPYPVNCPIGQVGWIAISLGFIVGTLFLCEMKDYSSESDTDLVLRRLLAGIFIVAYLGVLMSFLVLIRSLGTGNWGLAALLTMIATTKSTDIGAYFTGKAIGRRKLIPRLSPGKTWEGAIGGVVVATIVAMLCLQFLFPAVLDGFGEPEARPDVLIETPLGNVEFSGLIPRAIPTPAVPPIWLAFVLGPVLAISGMVGDLAESLVKRACHSKDSGDWLPGMGGVWDVTDSLIFAALPSFLCFVAAA